MKETLRAAADGCAMDGTQLKSFYQVAMLGSVTKASEIVHRSQPAISQQLHSLEEDLGTPLFERLGRQKMVLTAAGRRLLSFCEVLFPLQRELMNDLATLNDSRQGQLTVAAASATLGLMLSDSVRRFMDRHPEARLTLYDRPPVNGLELLRTGRVDLAFALESQIPSHFRSYWWRMGHFVLMLPGGHELLHVPHPTLEQIAQYPFIKLFPNVRYAAANKIEEAFFDRGLSFKLFLEAGNIHLIAEYVRRRLGISMVLAPEEGLDLFPGQLDYVRLDHIFPPESVRVCCRKNSHLSSLARFFLDTVLEGVIPPDGENAR